MYGRLYTQYESRIEGVDTFAVEQEGSLLSKGNEVIVPASGETAEDIAVASSVRRSGIIFGGDLNVVTPVSKLDPDYTALAITYGKAHDDLAKRAQGKSVVHVHGNDIAEVEISYPSESEQNRISTVVLGLDNLITLHQRKCQYRSLYGYLSWEQRKLGELCELNPTAVLPDSFEYVDLESVAGTDMISHRREEKLTAPSRAQRLASFGDIFYQTVRPYQKNNYFYELPDEDYVFSTGYAQLRPLCDGRFLFSSLQRDQFVSCVLEHCTGTSYPAINANDLAALFLAVPSDAEEQRLVGSILKPIDSLITLHQ